jgi:DNA-binding CsgD family transcriptional regulator
MSELAHLSADDERLFRAIGAGLSQRAVARQLNISPSLVAYRVAQLAKRLPGPGRPAVRISRIYGELVGRSTEAAD